MLAGLDELGLVELGESEAAGLGGVALLRGAAETTFAFGGGPLGVASVALAEIARGLGRVAAGFAVAAAGWFGGKATLWTVFEISGGLGGKFGRFAGVGAFGGEAIITARAAIGLRTFESERLNSGVRTQDRGDG